jgi:hypothetical protein
MRLAISLIPNQKLSVMIAMRMKKMSDTRHKDVTWGMERNLNGTLSYDQAQLAVLMDIRDEMKRLNQLLHCNNFMGIPYKLDRISANTHRPKRRKNKQVKPCTS